MSLYTMFGVADLPMAGLAEIYRATERSIADRGINRA